MSPTATWVRRRIVVALLGMVAAVTGIVLVTAPASNFVLQDWCSILPFWPGCHI